MFMKNFLTLLLTGILTMAFGHINAQVFYPLGEDVPGVQNVERSLSRSLNKDIHARIPNVTNKAKTTSNTDFAKSAGIAYLEDFENVAGSLPDGWTTIATPGSNDQDIWSAGALQFNGSPFPGASGSKYAYIIRYEDQAHDSWAFTPGIQLEANTEYIIRFWVYMIGFEGVTEHLEVKLGASASVAGMTTLIYENNTDLDEWTEVQYSFTPTTAGLYHIGLHSISPALGNGTLVDAIQVSRTGPLIHGNSTLDFGSFLNFDPPQQKTYTITNKGISGDLTVSTSSMSPEIALEGLPVTLAPGQTADILVTLDANTVGQYSGNFVLQSNDVYTPFFEVGVMATIEAARVTDYFFEDLEQGTPEGWTSENFNLISIEGINESRCYNLWTMLQPNHLTTHYVKLGTAPVLNFHYKAEEYSVFYDGAPSDPSDVSLHILVSNDFGQTFTEVYNIGPNGDQPHIMSPDYAEINIDLGAYANDTCQIRFCADFLGFSSLWGGSIFIDNVSAGTKATNDLAAVAIQGNTIPDIYSENAYTVSVKNNGSATQTAYTVKLMQEGDIEIASVPGTSIAENETQTFDLTWTPTLEGATSLYGEVVLTGDENEDNNQTNNLDVAVQPVDVITITVGTLSDTLINLPVSFGYKESASQTLYYANELGTNGGVITSLRYQANTDSEFNTGMLTFWIGETDKSDFTDGQWVDPSSLTLAFHNTMTIPGGISDVTIPLSTPYAYQGGNLVVYAVRLNTDFLIYKSFFGNEKQSRSLSLTSDEVGTITPINPGSGQIKNWIPVTTFTLTNTEKGELNGVVSDNTGVVEGAIVSVLGTQLYAITDINGAYSFPSLVPGTYSIEVSGHGYFTKTVTDVVVAANAVQTADVMLDKLPKYTVQGTVSAVESSAGIEGAMVRLMGYDNYKTLTNANGSFIISDVYGGSGFEYDVAVSVPYYKSQTGTVTVDADVNGLDFALTEIPYPVHAVSAAVVGEYPAISWEEPLPEFRYDNGINAGELGWENGYATSVMGSVHRHNAIINEISWFLTSEQGPHLTVNLFLFDLDEQGNPTTNILYAVADVPNTDMEWNTFELPNPVETPNGFMVGISYSGFMALGTTDPDDQHPLEPGMHYFVDDYLDPYKNFVDLSGYYNKHLMIRAVGEDLGEIDYNSYPNRFEQQATPEITGEIPVLTKNEISFDAGAPLYRTLNNSPKTQVDYTVYRLIEGQPQNEWALVAGNVTALTATDNDWNTLEPGIYQYAVAANYSLTSSEPKLSNTLPKGMEFEYTVNLVTGSANPAIGAVVKLVNQNTAAVHYVYSATANNNTVVFPSVFNGSYKLSVTLAGYEPYVQDVQIDAAGSHDAQLVEIRVTPFALDINKTGDPSEAVFSWKHDVFFDNIENHDNFIINNIGDYNLIDGDGIVTAGIKEVDYPNENYIGSYMVFNPYQTTPPMTDINFYRGIAEPHSGNKFLACMASKDCENNNWLILPQTEIFDGMVFKFKAKSILDYYYTLDRIKIGISETGTNQGDFTFIQPGDYIEVPGEWTEYSFDLSEYAGNEVYIAINCVSDGYSFMLMLDDIYCGMDGFDGAGESISLGYNIYLDGTEVATNVQTTEYTFTGLENGNNYTAGVRAVYGSGMSEMATINFTASPAATISVNPGELMQNIEPDSQASQEILIGNTGGSDLTWSANIEYLSPSGIISVPEGPAPQQGNLALSTAKALSGRDLAKEGETVVLNYDGDIANAIGLDGGGAFYAAARFPSSMTAPYAGYELESVDVFIDAAATSLTLNIWDAGTTTAPGTLLAQQPFSGTGWITVILDGPLEITGADIWVGYQVTHNDGVNPAGADAGPANTNGDWISPDGSSWEHAASYGLDYNWNIRANLVGGSSYNWLSLSPASGTVEANQTQELTVNFDATGLEYGAYVANIRIESNDPEMPVLEIPVSMDILTEVEELGSSFITAYPNPVSGNLYINMKGNVDVLELLDAQGKTIRKYNAEGKSSLIMNVTDVQPGVYLLRFVRAEKTVSCKKIIVK